MTMFYTITSGGADTNLQLGSLAAARREWRRLNEYRTRLTPGQMRELCGVVCSNLGLSVSQLLGQNIPQTREKVDFPHAMVSKALSGENRPELEACISKLLDMCEALRHFGKTPMGEKHAAVASLTYNMTKGFYDATFDLWEVMVEKHRRQSAHSLHDFTTVDDAIDNLELYAKDGTISHSPR